jgi:hypothetical protein
MGSPDRRLGMGIFPHIPADRVVWRRSENAERLRSATAFHDTHKTAVFLVPGLVEETNGII